MYQLYREGTTGIGGLSSAPDTRQSPKITQQRVCRMPSSANMTQQPKWRQRAVYWLLFLGHSTKALPSAKLALNKKKVGGRAAKWRWQRLYQVPWWLGTRQSLNVFAECNKIHPTNSLLCRVPLTDTRQSSDVRYWVWCSAGTCLFFAKCIYLSSITFLPSVFCPALSKLDILPSAFFCGAFYFFYTQQICCLLSAP